MADPYAATASGAPALRPSRVLRRIRDGKVARVLKLNTTDPKVAEIFASAQPDAIWLFRRPILDEWVSRGDVALADLVAHVYVHELAHHFGWSDSDIAAIDRWWE